jgi:hypothetical protein
MAADKGFSLPTAQQVMEKLALAEAEKASATARKQSDAEAEKKMLLEKLTKPSGVSDEEALRRVAAIIERAVSNGLTEVQVYRFPNALCTDRGRAINQQESGWEATLTGLPKRRCISFGKDSFARVDTRSESRSWTFRTACLATSASR